MRELKGDLWRTEADARCITTNGMTRPSDGYAVMGKGCAEEARHRFPGVDVYLGEVLRAQGNHVCVIWRTETWDLIAFPTKNHWRDKSDLALIRQSCTELMTLLDEDPTLERVLLPRPGCGAGGLTWPVVKGIIAPLLDDRVVVIAR